MSAKYISAEFFETTIESGQGAFLVDFTASWCGPCKMIAPMLDEKAAQYDGQVSVVKVDIDQARPLAAKLGIRGVPTLIVYKDGKAVAKHTGALNAAQFDALVANAL